MVCLVLLYGLEGQQEAEEEAGLLQEEGRGGVRKGVPSERGRDLRYVLCLHDGALPEGHGPQAQGEHGGDEEERHREVGLAFFWGDEDKRDFSHRGPPVAVSPPGGKAGAVLRKDHPQPAFGHLQLRWAISTLLLH